MTLQRQHEPEPSETIVCLGAARDVRLGRVSCPLEVATSIPLSACAGCRNLTWFADDRLRGAECSTGPE